MAQNPDEEETQLFTGLYLDDYTQVLNAFQSGADLNASDQFYGFPLFYAVFCKDGRILDLILENAEIPSEMPLGVFPQLIAAQVGNTQAVRTLVQAGMDPHVIDFSSYNLLSYAAIGNNTEIAKIAIENGVADLEPGPQKIRPIHLAAEESSNAVLKLILASNPDHHSLPTWEGLTPLHFAAKHNNLKGLELLLDKSANVNATDQAGLTPLHLAAKHKNIEALKLLLDAKADIHATALNGFTPLHYAARNGLLEGVELLMQFGASCMVVTSENETPVHHAVLSGDNPTLTFLLKQDCLSDSLPKPRLSPFRQAVVDRKATMLATFFQNIETEEMAGYPKVWKYVILNDLPRLKETLTNQNIDIRVDYLSLLSWSVFGVVPETSQFLVKKGAKTRDHLWTPLHYAAQAGNPSLVPLLRDYRSSSDTTLYSTTPLQAAIDACQLEVIEEMANYSLQYFNDGKEIALDQPFLKPGSAQIALFLLEHTPEKKLNRKEILYLAGAAIAQESTSLLKALLQRGVSINHPIPNNGGTFLHRATNFNQRVMIEFILEKGGNPLLKDKHGHTVLDLAVQKLNFEAYKTLYARQR